MRTDIYDEKKILVNLTRNKYQNKITIHLLDMRLPAGTEVETEETASYSMTPQYYADDCCMTSIVYIASIVEKTLRHHYSAYQYETHVYSAYKPLPQHDTAIPRSSKRIHQHLGRVPKDWRKCHEDRFSHLYRCAEQALEALMADLRQGEYNPEERSENYEVPGEVHLDYCNARMRWEESIDAPMMRLWDLIKRNKHDNLEPLNNLLGMEDYKAYIRQTLGEMEISKLRKAMGLDARRQHHGHMVLTGQPGTGISTAVRILAEVLHDAHMLDDEKVVQCDRKTLVTPYVYESMERVKELFDTSYGTIIQINEPYTMLQDEAGRCVLEEIERYTEEADSLYMVVLTGERKKMEHMLNLLPGLDSHMDRRFHLRELTREELLEIARRILAEQDYHMTPEAYSDLACLIDHERKQYRTSFGNGRWVRRFVEHYMLPAQMRRMMAYIAQGTTPPSRAMLQEVTPEDIDAAETALLRDEMQV